MTDSLSAYGMADRLTRKALDETVALLVQAECEASGHRFAVYERFECRDPLSVMCGRCGRAWRIGDER